MPSDVDFEIDADGYGLIGVAVVRATGERHEVRARRTETGGYVFDEEITLANGDTVHCPSVRSYA